MSVKTAAQALQNWKRGMSGAGQAYTEGVQRTDKDPMQAAAAAVDSGYYLQRVTSAQGRMSARLKATPKSAWVDGCIKTGAGRLASGALKGEAKAGKAFSELQGVWQQQQQAVASMAKGGLANAQARANRAIEIMMQHAGTA